MGGWLPGGVVLGEHRQQQGGAQLHGSGGGGGQGGQRKAGQDDRQERQQEVRKLQTGRRRTGKGRRLWQHTGERAAEEGERAAQRERVSRGDRKRKA